MLDKYRENFSALDADQAALLSSALRLTDETVTGDDVYEICEAAELSHAQVVLSLASDYSVLACRTLETLIGRTIVRSAPPETARRAPTDRKPRSARTPKSDPRVVVWVTPENPKRTGSASRVRFESWRVGATVSECLAAGLTGGDVNWDVDRGFVKLALPDTDEARAAREETR